MQYRLLSLLSEVEKAVRAGQEALGGPPLDSSRMVNFHSGLARIQLRTVAPAGTEPRGYIQLQHFALADGRACVRAGMGWHGVDLRRSVEIFAAPDVNWTTEAQRVAEAWLDGPGPSSEPADRALAASG